MRANLLTTSGLPLNRHSRSSLVPYFGVVGIKNLGDEILLDLARCSFPDHHLVPVDARRFYQRNVLHRLLLDSPWFVVGGGTLLLSEPLRRTLTEVVAAGIQFRTLGTGAQDSGFWGPLSGPIARSWQYLFTAADGLGVRGPGSLASLQRLSVMGARVVGDPAVVFATAELPPRRPKRVIGINFGTALGAVWGNDESRAIRVMLRVVSKLSESGWDVRLFSVWPPDTRLLRSLAVLAGLDANVVVAEYCRPLVFQREVAHCDVFVAMKLHAQILATCTGVPTLAVEYQPKTSDYMASIDSLTEVVRIDALEEGVLLEWVTRLLETREEVAARQWCGARRLSEGMHRYIGDIGGEPDNVRRWVAAARRDLDR